MPGSSVLLVGHGTSSPEGTEQFLQLVSAFASHTGGAVAGGFIEKARPTLAEAADQILATGAAKITVLPVVLLPAGHLKDDARAITNYLRRENPGADIRLARDLGVSNEIVACLSDRIGSAGGSPDGLLVVGRGSTDPGANSQLYAAARLVMERRPETLVEPAFVSLAPPAVAAGLDRLRRTGATEITVAPYFLFKGVLLDRIAKQAEAWSAEQGVPVRVAAELAVDPLVLSALSYRLEQAEAAAPNPNCDSCRYRRP